MEKSAWRKSRKILLEAIFFSHSRKPFSNFRAKFLSLFYMISLAYKIFHCFSANHNPELRCAIFTISQFNFGVMLFALMLHLNCTALSQSESSNFFICIITNEKALVRSGTFSFWNEFTSLTI